MTQDSPALVLSNVSKSFGPVMALDHISLEIGANEFFTLLGPSGCGKTTLLRLIAGFELANSGQICLFGKDIAGLPANKRPVNTVFQQYALFPHMSVGENVAFALRRLRRSESDIKKRVGEILETVDLAGYQSRFPHQLSGGQQQRVALARALVNRPSLLLLDEPLGALDLKLRREMQIELKAIQIEVGLTFLHVTHDQEEAMDMADTVAVMNKGHIEQMGSPEKLYDRPKTVFVSKFLGQSNLFIGQAQSHNEATVSIEVAGAKISVPKARAEKHTGTIAVGVRPEKATFHEDKPDLDSNHNLVGPGEIIDIRFTGVSNQYLIDVPGFGDITVFAQNVGKSPVVELGAQVWVSWKVEHAFGLSDLPLKADNDEA